MLSKDRESSASMFMDFDVLGCALLVLVWFGLVWLGLGLGLGLGRKAVMQCVRGILKSKTLGRVNTEN